MIFTVESHYDETTTLEIATTSAKQAYECYVDLSHNGRWYDGFSLNRWSDGKETEMSVLELTQAWAMEVKNG